jgi:hypothetical protein
MRLTLVFGGILTLAAFAAVAQNRQPANPHIDIAGAWNAQNASPHDTTHNTTDATAESIWPISLHLEVPTTFVFKLDGTKLTGRAHVDTCPGDGEITEGKIDGENVSFTVVTGNTSTSGPQTIYYAGKVHGDDMDLSMRWPLGRNRTLEVNLKGKRVRQ